MHDRNSQITSDSNEYLLLLASNVANWPTAAIRNDRIPTLRVIRKNYSTHIHERQRTSGERKVDYIDQPKEDIQFIDAFYL